MFHVLTCLGTFCTCMYCLSLSCFRRNPSLGLEAASTIPLIYKERRHGGREWTKKCTDLINNCTCQRQVVQQLATCTCTTKPCISYRECWISCEPLSHSIVKASLSQVPFASLLYFTNSAQVIQPIQILTNSH